MENIFSKPFKVYDKWIYKCVQGKVNSGLDCAVTIGPIPLSHPTVINLSKNNPQLSLTWPFHFSEASIHFY